MTWYVTLFLVIADGLAWAIGVAQSVTVPESAAAAG